VEEEQPGCVCLCRFVAGAVVAADAAGAALVVGEADLRAGALSECDDRLILDLVASRERRRGGREGYERTQVGK
jgi:hypothetical protein